ncbi:MAG: DUF5320 domain-containing protein [Desulfuromonadaceae bacterium]|nr:DUF5320 domain-containing protein [Desulfuromonadaceae bacterium]
MPRGDGTGPRGTGAVTGRGTGNCVGGQNRYSVRSGSGRGATVRRMCNWFHASDLAGNSAQENEGKLLEEQAEALKKQLNEIDSRLNELKKN